MQRNRYAPTMKISDRVKARLQERNLPFSANDNISAVLEIGDLGEMQREVEDALDQLLRALVIDVRSDHNTRDTAQRVAKMYLHEVFKGRYYPRPETTDFPNAKSLSELYLTGPISVRSTCSHHLVPIIGRAWIGVIPSARVIGLSKFNRIVDWVLSRPQIQEEAAVQLADEIEDIIKPSGLAVVIKASHFCMVCRGVRESSESVMTTSVMRGTLMTDTAARAEFLNLISI